MVLLHDRRNPPYDIRVSQHQPLDSSFDDRSST